MGEFKFKAQNLFFTINFILMDLYSEEEKFLLQNSLLGKIFSNFPELFSWTSDSSHREMPDFCCLFMRVFIS